MDNSFRESIKIDQNEKIRKIKNIIQVIINLPEIPEIDELTRHIKGINGLLNNEEITAIYLFGKKIRVSNTSKEMLGLASEEKLMRFIEKTAEDIRETKKVNSNIEYSLSIDRIIKKMDQEDRINSSQVEEYIIEHDDEEK